MTKCEVCKKPIGILAWSVPGKELCINCRDNEAWKDQPEEQKRTTLAELKIVPHMDWHLGSKP